jgi:general secretion pathway protein C
MEWLWKRYFVLVTLLVLVACAYFAGNGVSQIVAAAIFPAEDVAAPARPTALSRGARPPVLAAPSRHRDGTAILARNFFDSVTGPLTGVADAEAATLTGGVPPRCEGGIELVSTVVSTDAAWSMAAIKSGGTTMLYREGMPIGPQSVSRITWQYAFLRATSGAECYLGLFGAADLVAAARPVGPAMPPGDSDSAIEAEIARGIEQVSATEFNIQRPLVDRVLENQAELMRSARIVPHEEGGRIVGVKMFGIRPTSLLGRLGMQNGDVLHSINGYDMTSPDRALEAYARLRSSDRLTVSISRRGARTNLDYNFR